MHLKRNSHNIPLEVILASHRELLWKELTSLSCFLHPADQALPFLHFVSVAIQVSHYAQGIIVFDTKNKVV